MGTAYNHTLDNRTGPPMLHVKRGRQELLFDRVPNDLTHTKHGPKTARCKCGAFVVSRSRT